MPSPDFEKDEKLAERFYQQVALKRSSDSRPLSSYALSGAELNFSFNDKGDTPLHFALSQNYLDVVALLLDQGANPNRQNASGVSPFDLAAEQFAPDLYQKFVSAGSIQNTTAELPLVDCYHLASQGDFEKLDIRIRKLDTKSHSKLLVWASRKGIEALAAKLIELEADTAYGHSDSPLKSPLEDIREIDRLYPLTAAVRNGHIPIVKLLLEHGADPNLCNREYKTPICYAALHARRDFIQLLRDAGASLSIRTGSYGWVAYESAIRGEHWQLAIDLLSAGDSQDVMNTWYCGFEALCEVITEGGPIELVKLMVKLGAFTLETIECEDCSALEVAIEEERYDIAQFLKEHIAREISEDLKQD